MAAMATEGEWYVDATRTPIVWSTAVVSGKATQDIFRIARNRAGSVLTGLWARSGTGVSVSRVNAAIAVTTAGAVAAEPAPDNPGGGGTGGGGSTPSTAVLDPSLVYRVKTMPAARRGVNVAGAEFGTPGQAYGSAWAHENAASFAYLAGRGHRLVRYPFMWERLQPLLQQPFDAAEQGRLVQAVKDAGTAGLQVVLDLHNYGLYNGQAFGSAQGPKQGDFVDVWLRLSALFKNDLTVIGYGLMNEPRNLPDLTDTGRDRWKTYSQAVVTALRATGDATCILVGGYSGSTMGGWFNTTTGTPDPWIVDPIDNFRYEAHHYWDSANATYGKTYAQEETVNVGFGTDGTAKSAINALRSWIRWLEANNVKGFIGEFGWPRDDVGANAGDAALWNSLATRYLKVVDEVGDLLWTTAWATGSKWSTGYNLSLYGATSGVISTPRSNALVLEKWQQAVRGSRRGPKPPSLDEYISSATYWRGQSFDEVMMAGQSAVPLGTPVLVRIKLEEDGPLSNVIVYVNNSIATPTAGQSFAAIFNERGEQLAISGDIGASLTATAKRSLPMTTPTADLRAGQTVYAALLVNAATGPQIGRSGQPAGAISNRRFGLGAAAQTAMPASINIGSMTAAGSAFWMAVS